MVDILEFVVDVTSKWSIFHQNPSYFIKIPHISQKTSFSQSMFISGLESKKCKYALYKELLWSIFGRYSAVWSIFQIIWSIFGFFFGGRYLIKPQWPLCFCWYFHQNAAKLAKKSRKALRRV